MAVASGGRCMLNTGSLGTVESSRVSDRVADTEGLQPCVTSEITFYNSTMFTNVTKKSTENDRKGTKWGPMTQCFYLTATLHLSTEADSG